MYDYKIRIHNPKVIDSNKSLEYIAEKYFNIIQLKHKIVTPNSVRINYGEEYGSTNEFTAYYSSVIDLEINNISKKDITEIFKAIINLDGKELQIDYVDDTINNRYSGPSADYNTYCYYPIAQI